MSLAAVLPLAVVALAFIAYCELDLARAPGSRHLPRWLWAVICVVSVPVGGLVYLLLGREDR